jgi:hypothetical protein
MGNRNPAVGGPRAKRAERRDALSHRVVDREVAHKEIEHRDPKMARPLARGREGREEDSVGKTVLAVGRVNGSAEMRPP